MTRTSPDLRMPLVARVAVAMVLGGQVLLACVVAWKWGAGLSGDEWYYVEKAATIRLSGTFPRVLPEAGMTTRGWAKWGDVRPPGYPLFLALLGVAPESGVWGRVRVTAIQAGAIALSLALLASVLRPYFGSAVRGCSFALTLAVQPWTFEYCTSFLADSSSAALTLLGVISLGAGLLPSKAEPRLWLVVLGTASMALATFLRVEDLLFGAVIVTAAFVVRARRFGWTQNGTLAVAAILVWALAAFLHAGYWKYVSGRWRVVSVPKGRPAPGLYSWLQTHLASEQTFTTVYWAGIAGVSRRDLIPNAAPAGSSEKATIEKAFDAISAAGSYTDPVDETFARVAQERRERDPIGNVVLPSLVRSVQLWANLETNNQLLRVLSPWQRQPRRVLLAALAGLKLSVLALAAWATIGATRTFVSRPGDLNELDAIALMTLSYVITKSAFVGAVFGAPEHRLVLAGWPLLLATAGIAVARLSKRCERGAA